MLRRRPRVVKAATPIAALGIVFGDIGTSPLYAVKELIYNSGANHSGDGVIGAISLVIWLLTIVICFKYVLVVLRADNDEQGGVFALLALLTRHTGRFIVLLTALLVFGAGMLLGDGVITPAISVLSAIEGLSVATPSFEHYIVPITLGVLAVLFALQWRGTSKIGGVFGPVMLAWFAFLAITGLHSIAEAPRIFEALNPVNAAEFLGSLSLGQLMAAIGSVILVVTGGEALFADLGHIGRRPIRQSWFVVVYPALMLNYLGQGAYLLAGNEPTNENIFFSMLPGWSLYPSVALATVATVIASQALISGAFSLVAQGIALKYLPPMRIIHTHEHHEGQTYIPFINWALFFGSAFLVVTFQSSTHLAHAYGLAVAFDMIVTTLAVAAVARLHWKWGLGAVLAVFIPFGIIDGALFLGNVSKIPTGGYVPLAIGAVMVTIMMTWRWGREKVRAAFAAHQTMTIERMLEIKRDEQMQMFPCATVFLTVHHPTSESDLAPTILELFYRRFGALPKNMILLRINQTKLPYVRPDQRYDVFEFQDEHDEDGLFLSCQASYGFREAPDIEDAVWDILQARDPDSTIDTSAWMIHAGRERIIGSRDTGRLGQFRFMLFAALSRQSEPSYSYFGMDDDARLTVELVPVVL